MELSSILRLFLEFLAAFIEKNSIFFRTGIEPATSSVGTIESWLKMTMHQRQMLLRYK